MGLSTKGIAPVPIKAEKDSFPIWRVVSPSCLRGRIGNNPYSSSESHHWGVRRTLKSLKAPGALKLVTVFPPMPWIFAIMAETKRVLVWFRGLHFLQLKIKDFSDLPFGLIIQGAGELVC